MDIVFLIAGLIGSFCCLLMFFMLEQEKIDSKSMKFYGINGLGSFLVLISSAYEFDTGDMGTISLELIWTIISVMGFWKAYKTGKNSNVTN